MLTTAMMMLMTPVSEAAAAAVDSVAAAAFPAKVCVALLLGLVGLVFVRGRRDAKSPPVVGTMLKTIQTMGCAETPWFILELARSVESRVFQLKLPQLTPLVIVADGLSARRVLESSNKVVEKPGVYDDFNGVTQYKPTLFTMKTRHPQWAHRRKGLAPAFSGRRIRAALEGEGCQKVMASLFGYLDELQGSPVDAAELMTSLMLDLLGQISLGGFDMKALEAARGRLQGKEVDSPGERFVVELTVGLKEYALARLLNPWRKYYYGFTAKGRRARLSAKRLMDIAGQVLENYYAKKDKDPENDHIIAALTENDKAAYETEEERKSDVMTMLIGGHDTTGYTLAFCLYELAKKPELCLRLRSELLACKRPADCDLLARVCKETLRQWPVAAMGSFREVFEDIELPNGFVIRKGTHCIFPMLAINRAAVGVIRPDDFEPDRWDDPKQAQALADSYLPFAAGTRNCVGMALAQAELSAIVAAVVANFDMEPVKDFTPDYFLTLKPAGGLLRFKRAK